MSKVVTCEWCGQVFDQHGRKKSATCSVLCRFALKVQRSAEPGSCREWQAFRNPLGYGMFRVFVGESMWLAHRVAWELFVGDIPPGLGVLHKCDNPPCVNVAHLFLGTNADNNADKMAKGRHRALSGDEHPFRINPDKVLRGEAWRRARRSDLIMARGERHPRAVLSDALVVDIRRRPEGGERMTWIARSLGVSFSAVSLAAKRETWRHVP